MKKGFGLTIMIGEKMDPMMAKKKAMEQMMGEKPGFKMEKEMSQDDKENFVSMLVSPEEKEMIMKMRQGESEEMDMGKKMGMSKKMGMEESEDEEMMG